MIRWGILSLEKQPETKLIQPKNILQIDDKPFVPSIEELSPEEQNIFLPFIDNLKKNRRSKLEFSNFFKSDAFYYIANEIYLYLPKEIKNELGDHLNIIGICHTKQCLKQFLVKAWESQQNIDLVIISQFLPKAPNNRTPAMAKQVIDETSLSSAYFSETKVIVLTSLSNVDCCGTTHLSPSEINLEKILTTISRKKLYK